MIGNRLKNLLEELNIKQNELAQKSQVTEATISNYISGKQLPKLGVVERIADTLNVSVDYLLGRDVYRTGNRIKQLRLQKGLKQEVLAKKLGITQQMVSLYEKNINEPDIETIKKLSEIFNCSIDYLLGRYANNDSDSENKEIFANNLKYYMKLNNKTRLDVCNDLGFSYTTFTSWCKGQFYPRIDKIESLANYFSIEKSDLIENKSNVERQNIKDFAVNQSNYDNSKYENNSKTKVEQILELADGLNIQEANYLIKQLNKAVIKIEKEAK